MTFNSITFVIFFAVVYSFYLFWDRRWQNRLLLLANIIFYSFWDWRFLSLLIFSKVMSYWCGLQIGRSPDDRKRKAMLWLCVLANLLLLIFFKYFNFFSESAAALFSKCGLSLSVPHLNMILPLGISFYTFQSMAYPIDVYRKKIAPVTNFFEFALFMTFFPLLVAGPIERAPHLIPQIRCRRVITLEGVEEGCFLLLWGYFLKVFAADNLAKIVNPLFDSSAPYNGIQVLLATYAFCFQIYCDFSGYSHIARGLGKLMGFDLMINFQWPFFASNLRDFWRRWHISLMSWLKDYVYIPLGGNRVPTWRWAFNLFLVFLLSGLWHGARWNFVLFGIYHGTLMVLYALRQRRREQSVSSIEREKNTMIFWLKVLATFQIVACGFLIFRAQTLAQIAGLFQGLIWNFHFTNDFPLFQFLKMATSFFGLTWFIIFLEYWQFKNKELLAIFRWNWIPQGVVYYLLVFFLLTFGAGGGNEFIYFQF